ncbi:MAG: UDP-3-O-(3-hydroxymyristoyl)glucosamine N-acyltransferase [Bacteroidales bacterium]|nr:UDP-3-O-(3-hydroxymyristoyl)glucosamine N-acyltransferase [Bacteroidales bacterium]
MKFTAKQIAELLNGEVIGDSNIAIDDISKIEKGEPGTMSFLANPKYSHYLYTTRASIVLVNKNLMPNKSVSTTLIKVEDAYTAFSKLLEIYNEIKSDKSGISKTVAIGKNVKLGKNLFIGDFVYIGDNVVIEDNVKIYPQVYIDDNTVIKSGTILFSGVKIYSNNIIGKDCILHAGVIIGADGFGFALQKDHTYKKVSQIGNVVIEDNVEIGANTTIDRATLGSTIIRKGVKLDNLIQVAHNVEIGENTVIAAQTGISGSSKIGKNCMIGGQVGIAGHITIADNVSIGAQSGIASSIKKEGTIFLGTPAIEAGKFKRSSILFKNFVDIEKRIRNLEKK